MNRIHAWLVLLLLAFFASPLLAQESGVLDKEEEDAVTYESEAVAEDDFDTQVNPVHESSLQGFDCMDKNGDGYLDMEELEQRAECVEHAGERGMAPDTRTALVLAQMDADRDRRISRREFNIWNEMQTQDGDN